MIRGISPRLNLTPPKNYQQYLLSRCEVREKRRDFHFQPASVLPGKTSYRQVDNGEYLYKGQASKLMRIYQ